MSKFRQYTQTKAPAPTPTPVQEAAPAADVTQDNTEPQGEPQVSQETTTVEQTEVKLESFPTAINEQITDSVVQSNTKPVEGDESPAVAAPNIKFASGSVVTPTGAVGVQASAEFQQAISEERTDKPVDTRSAWEYRIDAILTEGTNKRQRYVATQMQAYLSDMAPNKPVDTDTGVLRQKQLWRCLKNVVSNEEGFEDAMNLTIDYFREHSKGALGAIYIHRFAPDLDLSRDESRGLEQLCNIFMTAAGVVNKKDVLKHCALRTVELKGVDEIVRERLYSYFDN